MFARGSGTAFDLGINPAEAEVEVAPGKQRHQLRIPIRLQHTSGPASNSHHANGRLPG
jgi:hypothetical protein